MMRKLGPWLLLAVAMAILVVFYHLTQDFSITAKPGC